MLSLNGLSRLALPLASLGSFCTHPLPRVLSLPATLLYTPPHNLNLLNAIHGPMAYITLSRAKGYWWTERPAYFCGHVEQRGSSPLCMKVMASVSFKVM